MKLVRSLAESQAKMEREVRLSQSQMTTQIEILTNKIDNLERVVQNNFLDFD